MYKRLSYALNVNDPGYPDSPVSSIEANMQISRGDAANTYTIHLFNHFSSHMDAPKHFNDDGPSIAEIPIENFIFKAPLLIDVPKSFGCLITRDELSQYKEQISKADLLLIRTGFSSVRSTQPEKYAGEGPGVSSDACKYLLDEFPSLKAVAVDFISLTSCVHPQDGVLAHQYMMGKFHGHYVCVIEDINLQGLDGEKLKQVFAIPLIFEGIDSSPVTVIADVEE